jgi:hypothetical protein
VSFVGSCSTGGISTPSFPAGNFAKFNAFSTPAFFTASATSLKAVVEAAKRAGVERAVAAAKEAAKSAEAKKAEATGVDRLVGELRTKHSTVFEMLKRMHRNQDGKLDRDEVCRGLTEMGVRMSSAELDWVMRAFDADEKQSVAALSAHCIGSGNSNQLAALADLDGFNHDPELYEEALKRTKMNVGEAYESFFVNEALAESLRESETTHTTHNRPVPCIRAAQPPKHAPCRLLERCKQEDQEARRSGEAQE